MTRPDRKANHPRRPTRATLPGGVFALLRYLIAQARYRPERHYMRGRSEAPRATGNG
ncbi:hypothetical protein [Roseomonas sp. KE2513]|uniref:hypothetical protein n=1 Tax=Roseomonas sp. KE2513 TaxID=2479202 RepID=UPI0018DF22CB|nr:hypothetical protein [Roseomonas sp. KE2513]